MTTAINDDEQLALAADVDNSSLNVSFSLMPAEILLNVAVRLPRRKLLVLLLVCRSWNIALTPLLYRSIVLNSNRQFELLLETIFTTVADKQLGQLIYELKITYYGRFSSIHVAPQFHSLIGDNFNNRLRHVKLLPLLQKWMNCGRIWLDTIFNNSQELESVFYGDRLVNLSLCPETQQDLQTLSELRALEELSIRNESFSRPLMISYSYLEKLHTNLTCLRSLELRRIEPSGEALTDITVCDTVRRLRLGSESSRMWNPYFARKYSHLEDLELCVREIRTNMSTKEALTAASCRRLKRFACQHFDCRLWFLESLHAIRAPVEELRFGFREADLLSKSIHCYYQTLTKIIFSNAYGIPVPQLVKQLTACRHLTDLSLFSASEAMELDLILDELNGLEHVHLEAKQIELSKHRTQITHRQLKKVNFSVQDADSQVWTYLSQYCPCILSIDCTYGKDMTSSTVMYYLNPGLRYLKVEARGICLYKLVQISEEERIRNQNMDHRELIEKHDDAGSTNWYPSDEFSKRYGLLYLETSKGDSLLHGSYNDAGNQGELGSLPVIYIVCHYPDEISIEHHKLYN